MSATPSLTVTPGRARPADAGNHLERCVAGTASPEDWMTLAAAVVEQAPEAAACAASLAFERQPELLRRARTDRRIGRLARLMVADRDRRLQAFLDRPEHQRADPAARTMLLAQLQRGRSLPRNPGQEPFQSLYPGLPDRPWWEVEEIPGLGELFEHGETIAAEFLAWRESGHGLEPYVTAGRFAEQFDDLAESTRWGSCHLVRKGAVDDGAQRHFPATLGVLQSAPLIRIPRQAPEVFFSVLAPGTSIPPHHGQANWKLTAHLCLDDPPGCSLTVRGERRETRAGDLVVFDDSYLHRADNPADRPRAHLVFETWNPAVPESGRALLRALHEDRGQWRRHRRELALEAAAGSR